MTLREFKILIKNITNFILGKIGLQLIRKKIFYSINKELNKLNNEFSDKNVNDFLSNLYEVALNRKAATDEINHHKKNIIRDKSYFNTLLEFCKSKESIELRNKLNVLFRPPGHFYSPINDPRLVKKYHLSRKKTLVSIDYDEMKYFYQKHLSHQIDNINFLDNSVTNIFPFKNNSFSGFDAYVYSAFVRSFKPRKVIEIGSGFSTLCLLSQVDYKLDSLSIEPYPHDLLKSLKINNIKNHKVYKKDLQKIDMKIFQRLDKGDLLFIDSTHVLKTFSDVWYELFEILPKLKKGVFIHIHDIFWPFEYHNSWNVTENRSWNEIYALELFLYKNSDYKIRFFNSYFFLKSPFLKKYYSKFGFKGKGYEKLRTFAGSFYLEKVR